VRFEFESDSNSNSNLKLISKLFIKSLTPFGPASLKAMQPAQLHHLNQPATAALRAHRLVFSLLYMTGGTPLSSPTFFPLWPSWRRTYAPAPHPSARDGTAAPPGRPARRVERCAHFGRFRPRGGLLPFYPRTAVLRDIACAAEAGATSPALAVKPGATEGFRITPRTAALQRREEGRNPRCPSHQPHWGFLPPFLCLCP
jgi:hypothetical protein